MARMDGSCDGRERGDRRCAVSSARRLTTRGGQRARLRRARRRGKSWGGGLTLASALGSLPHCHTTALRLAVVPWSSLRISPC
jgi:hypothetical protein